MAKSRNGPHKAPFIGELAAKGGLEVKRSAPTHKTAGCVFFFAICAHFHRLYAIP